MKSYMFKNWPLIISSIIFGVLILFLLIQSINQNQGHLIYALDDAYIHMAIAKNFAQHGIWGITKYEFTSTSSSLFWTLLISFSYFIFGSNELIPFILNIIFALGTFSIIYLILRRFKIPQFYIFIVLLSIMFLTPFPALVFTGMEHILHIFLMILFIYLSASMLKSDRNSIFKYLLMLSFLLMITRHESFFLICIVSFLFILKKKYLNSILLIVVSFIPLVIYGLISTSKGWLFFPNSLVLKSILTGNEPLLSKIYIFNIFNHFINQLFSEILILISLSSLFLIINLINKKFKDLCTIMLAIFISIALSHLLFANTGWFYRYEAYLLSIGIFINSIVLYQFLRKYRINFNINKTLRYLLIILVFGLIIIPLAPKGCYSFSETSLATHNIYEQQYQIGLFIHEFYSNESIVLNDIGAVNYLADIKCIDIYGLGNKNVIKALKNGSYNAEMVSRLTEKNNVKLIVIYENWFENLPSRWIKVCDWKIKNNIVCGDDTVSFYVKDTGEKDNLIENLRNFSSKLPRDIEMKIYN
ncbi:MAG: hypothetical protein QMD61_03235 [Methanobacterium sp.]|nr:hypothetical protein [Methanobacterium sp.]